MKSNQKWFPDKILTIPTPKEEEEKKSHSMMLSPPCFTVWMALPAAPNEHLVHVWIFSF